MGDVLLDARRIGKSFGGVQALRDVSLTIRRGEIYGLIGPNGAGKTTFFNVLTGLYSADAGEVMPPKSTWFEPKLADGLASHVLD